MRPEQHNDLQTELDAKSNQARGWLSRNAFAQSALFGVVAVCGALLIGGLVLPSHADHLHSSQLMLIGAASLALGALIATLILHMRLSASDQRATDAENRLQAAVDCLSDGFVIYDKDERFVMCNDQYRRIYPAIRDQLVPGAKFSDLAQALIDVGMTPDNVETPSAWRESRIAEFRRHDGEFVTQYADGRWVLLRDRKLPDGGSVGIRTDITNLKNREQALVNSERRIHDLVERAPVAIYVHRAEVILYANSTTAQLLGYSSPQQLLGKNVFDLIHPDHHRLATSRFNKLQSGETPLPQIDMKFRRADGSVIYTEAQVSTIDFDGKPAQESILRDITARRRTERALMESELRYRTLFELAPDAMLVHDGEKILFANAAAGKMFAVSDERKLFGTPLADLLPDAKDAGILSTSAGWDDPADLSEIRLQRADRQSFEAEIVTTPTNYLGEAVFHTVIRDVTERKQLDAAMSQNAKLASLGGMAAGLAHELSQPLNILRFAAEGGMLKMNRGKADDALHLKNYKLIQDQAERMGAIMDSMRIFSRKDPGPMTTFDLTLSVRNIVNLLRNPYRIDDVHMDVSGHLSGVHVLGNALQLEQVLLNLMKNARDSIVARREEDAQPLSGHIRVDCRPRPDKNDALITISDNGGGIVADDIKRIFDPFFTTKEVGQGTGLGLSLSHEIITGMSGTLSAQNTADGACFSIALPLQHHAAEPLDQPQPLTGADAAAVVGMPPAGNKERHVLVVEDEIEAARAMADYLAEEGFLVTTANDGHAGLEAFRQFAPDIVITDIRMPGFSGTELISALRDLNAELPIIAVTGHMGETESIDPGPGVTPVDVLKKPVSLQELSRKIGTMCPL